jgi:hypothetical protein
MSYQKPQIVLAASAVDVVLSTGKGLNPHPDAPMNVTISAYEADE